MGVQAQVQVKEGYYIKRGERKKIGNIRLNMKK